MGKVKIYIIPLLIILALMSLYPYVFEMFMPLPPSALSIVLFLGLFFTLSLFGGKGDLPIQYKVVSVAVAFFYVCKSIYHEDTYYIKRLFLITLVMIIL